MDQAEPVELAHQAHDAAGAVHVLDVVLVGVGRHLAQRRHAARQAVDLEQRREGDVLGAHALFMDAFWTDVRADLAEWRASRGFEADPTAAYLASGYQEKIEAERVGGQQAGWGA